MIDFCLLKEPKMHKKSQHDKVSAKPFEFFKIIYGWLDGSNKYKGDKFYLIDK